MKQKASLLNIVPGGLFVSMMAATGMLSAETIRLSPEKVVELAKTQSVTIRAAQHNVQAQEYAVKSAKTGFLPTLSMSANAMHIFDKPQMELGGSGGFSTTSVPVIPGITDSIDGGDRQLLNLLMNSFSNMKIETPDNIYVWGLNAAWPLYTGGKIRNGFRAAAYGLEAQKHAYERTVDEIGLTAQKLFWGYVGALKGLDAVQETRQWFETLLRDQQKMYENGLIIELDVLNSRIQLGNFKLAEERLQNSIRTVADQMLLFLGLPQGSEIDADTSLLAGAAIAPASTDSIDQWLGKREDLRAVSSQIKAMRALKSLQLGSYWPTIAAFGSYGANNQYSTKEGDLKLSSSVGLQLSWTLLDWGKASREAQKMACQIRAAQLQEENLREMVKLKYFELSRTADESVKACAIAQEDLETAKKALAIAKLKYDAQAITNTELLNARNQLTQKMVAYAQARINVILAIEEYKVAPLAMGPSQQTP